MKVNIVCPNGRTVPFVAGPDAPTVRFQRWRDLLCIALWPTLTFGDGYAAGRIRVSDDDLDRILDSGGTGGSSRLVTLWFRFWALFAQMPWSGRTRRRDIEAHYDASNSYYRLMFGATSADGVGSPGDMVYSCARFLSSGEPVTQAQRRKIINIFAKLGLLSQKRSDLQGRQLLDIGCGWGDLAVMAAKMFGIKVLGITLSPAQLDRARRLAAAEGVDDLVQFELMNYLDLPKHLTTKFDYITSVGMFEHVSRSHQRHFFRVMCQMLAPDGVALLHAIVRQVPGPLDLWVSKRIFPHGHLAAAYQVERQLAHHGLFTTQAEYLWEDYALTLESWLRSHRANRELIVRNLGESFYRKRLLWLKGSIHAFRYGGPSGSNQTGLRIGQWLVTVGKPAPASWPLGPHVDDHHVEQLLGTAW